MTIELISIALGALAGIGVTLAFAFVAWNSAVLDKVWPGMARASQRARAVFAPTLLGFICVPVVLWVSGGGTAHLLFVMAFAAASGITGVQLVHHFLIKERGDG